MLKPALIVTASSIIPTQPFIHFDLIMFEFASDVCATGTIFACFFCYYRLWVLIEVKVRAAESNVLAIIAEATNLLVRVHF